MLPIDGIIDRSIWAIETGAQIAAMAVCISVIMIHVSNSVVKTMVDTRPLFTIAAFAVIFDDEGNVLLCHRRDMDAWNLPGGGLEIGELPNECVIREVREETGLEVVIERLIGVYGKPGRSELVFAFVCKVVGGELRTSSESDQNFYYKPDSLPPNTLLKHAERIFDALGKPPKPLFRMQGGKNNGRQH